MKVAMVGGGLQRFNSFFKETFDLLQGADEINLYMYLWKNNIESEPEFIKNDQLNIDYVKNVSSKINQIKIELIDEPDASLVPEILRSVEMVPGSNDNGDYLDRIFKQHFSLHKAFQINKEEIMNHDCVIRFRPDCKPDRPINLKSFDLNLGIYTPNNTKVSLSKNIPKICDQFAIGNPKNMEIYFNNYNSLYNNILNQVCKISQETLLSCHLLQNNVTVFYSNFNYDIKNRPLVRDY